MMYIAFAAPAEEGPPERRSPLNRTLAKVCRSPVAFMATKKRLEGCERGSIKADVIDKKDLINQHYYAIVRDGCKVGHDQSCQDAREVRRQLPLWRPPGYQHYAMDYQSLTTRLRWWWSGGWCVCAFWWCVVLVVARLR